MVQINEQRYIRENEWKTNGKTIENVHLNKTIWSKSYLTII